MTDNKETDMEEIEYLPVDTQDDESDGTFDEMEDPAHKEAAERQRHADAERGIIGHRPDDDPAA